MENNEIRDKASKVEMRKNQENILNQTAENAHENSKELNENSTSG